MADQAENVAGCPLCGAAESRPFHRDARREYRECPVCRLVFVPPRYHLAAAAEKACYDLHQNSPDDPRYRQFLSRLLLPLQMQLRPRAAGLDFGSGPGPTLSVMCVEAGFRMEIYDPFYAPDETVWERRYDFVTASEVLEHLRSPGLELTRVWSVLEPGGWLGVMTKRVQSQTAFARWHYKEDPTHVCFYAAATFEWLVARWSARLSFAGSDVVLMQKPVESSVESPM